MLALNNNVSPLNDLPVRQAINYAIDIQEIIDTAFYGRGEPTGSPVIPALSAFFNDKLTNPYPVNLERAKILLDLAGYSDGFPLVITVPSNYTMHVDTAQVLVNQLGRIGINASIKLVDWGTWLSEVYVARRYEATIISVDSVTISPRGFLERYHSNSSGNFVNFSSPRFDSIYEEALNEADTSRRTALYLEAQEVISEEAASAFIQDIRSFIVFPRGRFGGFMNYPLYATDFSTVYEIHQ
jgi:peptide/nickel transport system substrate-binding protein